VEFEKWGRKLYANSPYFTQSNSNSEILTNSYKQ